MRETKNVDLVVVGAGFAGLACAWSAALRGLRVLVIDRKPYVGSRLHTTGILVKEAAALFNVPATLTRRIDKVRLYAPSLRYMDLASPSYYFLATDTPGLLQWLAGRARCAGAQIRVQAPLGRAVDTRDRLWLPDLGVRTRFLVGADGATSSVARQFNLSRNRHFLVGLEAHLEGVDTLAPDYLHCFVDPNLAPGYLAWAVPNGSTTQLGLAFQPSARSSLDELKERVRSIVDPTSAHTVEIRRGLIPVGGPLRTLGNARTLLIGDAAGVVSPLTAGGIHTALQWGEFAGARIADWIVRGEVHPVRAFTRAIPRFRFKRAARWMYERLAALPMSSVLIEAGMRLEFSRRLARLVYFHNRGLLTVDGWRAVMRAEHAKAA